MTTRRGQLALLLALVITATWMFVVSPARASAAEGTHLLAQTQLEEIEPPGSHTSGGHGDITLVVDPFDFSRAWLEVQRSATGHGGSVLSATAESIERDGRTVSVGVAELRVPATRLGDALSDLLALGALADGRFSGDGAAVVNLTVTVTDSADASVPLSGDELGSESTLSRSLDTAGNVVLSIAGIAIIVAAAIVPIGLLGLVAYGLYRWLRTQFDAPSANHDAQVVDRGDSADKALVD